MSPSDIASELRHYVETAFTYVFAAANDDGGLAAIQPGGVSGCWTTAEAIDYYLSGGIFGSDPATMVRHGIEFLLDTQISTGEDRGGWPVVATASFSSAMATGHCLSALERSTRYLGSDQALLRRIDTALVRGLEWIARSVNTDGGYGVCPCGGGDGIRPRMLATTYVLRGLSDCARMSPPPKLATDAIAWIKRCRKPTGGFGADPDIRTGDDPDNTARAISALLRSRHLQPNDPMVAESIKRIKHWKDGASLWSCGTETYVLPASPGQMITNNNTLFDVGEAFALAEFANCHEEFREILEYLCKERRVDGSWVLTSPARRDDSIVMWATSENAHLLAIGYRRYLPHRIAALEQRHRKMHRVWIASVISSFISMTVLIAMIAGLPTIVIEQFFGKDSLMTTSMLNWLTGTVLVGVLINLLSSWLWERRRR